MAMWGDATALADNPTDFLIGSEKLSTSSDQLFLAGIAFMVTRGRNGKATEHVHWQGGNGGVILGPNYDFGDRDASTIIRDLQSIGVRADVAKRLSAGARLHGRQAQQFVESHQLDVTLTIAQQSALVEKVNGAFRSASAMRLSPAGFALLVTNEGNGKAADHTYYPGGLDSGVTLGPGYDFGARKNPEIIHDLRSIGVSADVAQKLSAGAGLHGPKAEKFADDHRHDLTLTNTQYNLLLKMTVSEKEAEVRKAIHFPVTQYMFDALVSLTYNPGGKMSVITKSIANGNLGKAEQDWLSRVNPGSTVETGLRKRRIGEVNLLTTGRYR